MFVAKMSRVAGNEVLPLRFGRGNAKLDDAVFTFSLPAGHSCPYARDCLSKSDPSTGRITDGRRTRFRCYAASMEARHPSIRNARWHNYRQVRACRGRAEMARLILHSLSPFVGYLRVHDSGDFFSQDYFDAWLDVAREREGTRFYAYSKSVQFWVRRLDVVGDGRRPAHLSNFVLTASLGGRSDRLIEKYNLRHSQVVYSEEEATKLGLEIDHDDSHAMNYGGDFALLIHGQQPKGSDALAAVKRLREAGWSGYRKETRKPLPTITR